MRKSIKKNIAREFLFLFGSTIIFFIAIAIWSWRHEVHSRQHIESEKELEGMRSRMYVRDEAIIIDLYSRVKTLGYSKKIEDFKVLIIKDQEVFEDCYEYAKSKGYIKSQQDFTDNLSNFVNDRVFEAKSKKYDQLKNNIDNRYASIFSSMSNNSIWFLGEIILFLAFGLRYLIYAIKWSIKQLKE